MKDVMTHNSVYSIYKYYGREKELATMLHNGMDVLDAMPDAIEEFGTNVLLDVGINELLDILIGDSANVFDNANTTIGVGDDDTVADSSQTDLIGSNTKYNSMDSGYPSVAGTTVTFRATFADDDANFDWNEFVIKQSVSGICLNRKVDDKGTKTSGDIWVAQIAITLT
jgi:hypothetical protein